ncbi:hypothetical protein JOQ06_004559, partial [Pogonophryne albipinna]
STEECSRCRPQSVCQSLLRSAQLILSLSVGMLPLYRCFDLEHLHLSLRRAARARPPSAPQNLVYNINQTSVSLEWSPPADTGGRNDVTYRVICRRCSWEPEECVQCGPNVGFSPAQAGLVESYVSIMDLLAHANYTFEVEAVNGVSELSRTQRLFAAVSIATGQA